VFVIPPIEEILFRGWLWKMCRWKINPYWTWIITSLVFAAVHAEPLHILGLLPLSFFLGWLRKETGGIEYSTIAHITNNAVACLLMII
jgi:membrane protease YdiL (CAAX protease family)